MNKKYYKGTLEECNSYNDYVTEMMNFQGYTSKYSEVIEYEDFYVIECHLEYTCELEIIDIEI